jgi:hypothetical protein
MSTFPDRAVALRGVLKARRSPQDGGWPHRLDVENAAPSIASTAHVIEILRVSKYEFQDPAIQGGLAYLASAVRTHTQTKRADSPGRGASARYPAYALWGLTRYPQAPFSKNLEKGFEFSLSWLHKNRLEGGGWAIGRDGNFSLTVTTPAVHALDRLAFLPTEWGKAADTMRKEARLRVMRERRGSKKSPWWTPYGDRGKPSGAATAMAVLTLAGGGEPERDLARNAIGWLLKHPEEWVNHCESDTFVEDRSWQMLSFSLGLRAVLHPCAKESPDTEILRAAIEHWDDLWIEEANAWTHIPGAVPNTTGSFGVIVAARALKRAFDFDPATHMLGARSKKAKRSKRIPLPRPPLTVTLNPSGQRIHVVNQMGETMVKTKVKGPKQWLILEQVARRHLEGQATNDQSRQTISLTELKAHSPSAEAVTKAIDRVNALLSEVATKKYNQHLPSLIEDITPSGGEPGFGFDRVDSVVFCDDLE